MVKIKRFPPKMFIMLSIIAVTIFLLIQLIFQRTKLVMLPRTGPSISFNHNIDDILATRTVNISSGFAGDHISHKTNFTIILWTPFFGEKDYTGEWKDNCDYTNCIFTSNRDSLKTSDGLIFHLRDVSLEDLPTYRNPSQRWMLLNHESPPHSPRDRLKPFEGLINWTLTYRFDSDVNLTPLFVKSRHVLPQPSISHNRSGLVSWLVSNCDSNGNREEFVEELKKYINVDVYGSCGTKHCYPKMSPHCYQKLAENYYFYLSFENSICPDYVTEKFYAIVDYPLVPVVFGGADYKNYAPPQSYIDALSFPSPKELAEYLHFLIKNPERYDEYFKWKRFYVRDSIHWACRTCSLFNKAKNEKKVWKNLVKWWFDDVPCKKWVKNKAVVQVNL